MAAAGRRRPAGSAPATLFGTKASFGELEYSHDRSGSSKGEHIGATAGLSATAGLMMLCKEPHETGIWCNMVVGEMGEHMK